MRGRAFLDLARDLLAGRTEAHWRGAAIHAYYALLLEGRDMLAAWNFPCPPHQTVHAFVRLRLTFAGDSDLQRIGKVLDDLVQLRNRASYNLQTSPTFASDARARQAVANAMAALALLDAIAADPVRRSKAIASFPP